MPAWITSELRELVCVPIASSASRITTSRPASASARATARPTTPAPITTHSTLSMACFSKVELFREERANPEQADGKGHRPRTAVEGGGQPCAQQRAQAEGDGAQQRRGRA